MLINVPQHAERITGTDALWQLYVLSHWHRSSKSNLLSLLRFTDNKPTSNSSELIALGAWQGSYWSVNFKSTVLLNWDTWGSLWPPQPPPPPPPSPLLSRSRIGGELSKNFVAEYIWKRQYALKVKHHYFRVPKRDLQYRNLPRTFQKTRPVCILCLSVVYNAPVIVHLGLGSIAVVHSLFRSCLIL